MDAAIHAFRAGVRTHAVDPALQSLDSHVKKSFDEVLSWLHTYDATELKKRVVLAVQQTHGEYLALKVAEINSEIRTFNLLAPLSSLHKWKLTAEHVLQAQSDHLMATLDDGIKKTKSQPPLLCPLGSTRNLVLSLPVRERLGEPMDIWRLVRRIFKNR